MDFAELLDAYEEARRTDRAGAANLRRQIEFRLMRQSATGSCQVHHCGWVYAIDSVGDLVRTKAATEQVSLSYESFSAGPSSVATRVRRKRAS